MEKITLQGKGGNWKLVCCVQDRCIACAHYVSYVLYGCIVYWVDVTHGNVVYWYADVAELVTFTDKAI